MFEKKVKQLIESSDSQHFIGVHSTNVFAVEEMAKTGVLPIGHSLFGDHFYFTPVKEVFENLIDEELDEGTSRDEIFRFNQNYAFMSSFSQYMKRNVPEGVGRPLWFWDKVSSEAGYPTTYERVMEVVNHHLRGIDEDTQTALENVTREALKFRGVHLLLSGKVANLKFDPEDGVSEGEGFTVNGLRIPYLDDLANGLSVDYVSGIKTISERDRDYLDSVLNKES